MRSYRDVNICSVCGKEYKDLSEKVYCPVCGASYHRECYKIKNKCVFEELHGTEYEYNGDRADEMIRRFVNGEEDLRVDLPPEHIEPIFESEVPLKTQENTPKKTENDDSRGEPVTAGFHENDDIGGVSAGDAARFVVFNYERFVPLFAKMFFVKKKASFNFLAFLFPECWFFLRKHYLAGFGASFLLVASKVFLLPAVIFFESFLTDSMSYFDYASVISLHLHEMPLTAQILMWVSFIMTILIHLLSGIFADLIYKHHAYAKIREFRMRDSNSNGLQLSLIGGVNPLLIFVGTAITTFIPQVIEMLFF